MLGRFTHLYDTQPLRDVTRSEAVTTLRGAASEHKTRGVKLPAVTQSASKGALIDVGAAAEPAKTAAEIDSAAPAYPPQHGAQSRPLRGAVQALNRAR